MVRVLCSWRVVSSHHLENVCLLRRECDQTQGRERGKEESWGLIWMLGLLHETSTPLNSKLCEWYMPFLFSYACLRLFPWFATKELFWWLQSHIIYLPTANLSTLLFHADTPLPLYPVGQKLAQGNEEGGNSGCHHIPRPLHSTMSSECPRNSLVWEILGLRNASQRKASVGEVWVGGAGVCLIWEGP